MQRSCRFRRRQTRSVGVWSGVLVARVSGPSGPPWPRPCLRFLLSSLLLSSLVHRSQYIGILDKMVRMELAENYTRNGRMYFYLLCIISQRLQADWKVRQNQSTPRPTGGSGTVLRLPDGVLLAIFDFLWHLLKSTSLFVILSNFGIRGR